jgi:nicotinamide phosphoribosyltransferase
MKTIITATDSYKCSMAPQYPKGTTVVYSYIEARAGGVFDKYMFKGINNFRADFLDTPLTMADIDKAERIIKANGVPFEREKWEYIVNEHGGYLPLEINAVDEGKVFEEGTVLVTVHNTDKKCWWLTTYVETALLRAIWYPSTVATISYSIKRDIIAAMQKSCDTMEKLPFMLHDFGARGVSSGESAGIGGAAHLANFMGSDTLEALEHINRVYSPDSLEGIGVSIPAMEHSTVTSWGRYGEVDAFRNMLKQYGGEGNLLACVSDSYDLENAVKNIWGGALKKEVIDSGTCVVVRPDSGDPVEVVMLTLDGLAENYGYTVNSKGYMVLNNVRVIQGDGIDQKSINAIIDTMLSRGWSLDNIAFGMGGALLQHCDRDWGRWAMKCSAIKVDGEWRDVFKQPKTDSGKTSKRGLFRDSRLKCVYRNGVWMGNTSFSNVVENAKNA